MATKTLDTKDIERQKKIVRLIKLAWSSFESHLEWTYTDSEEGTKFHKNCNLEYAEMLLLLAQLQD